MAVHLAALHDEPDVLGDADVGQRVARHGDDVGQQAGLETPPVVHVDQLGGHGGGGPDGLEGGHAPVDQGQPAPWRSSRGGWPGRRSRRRCGRPGRWPGGWSPWPGGIPRPPWPGARERRGTRPCRRPGRWSAPGSGPSPTSRSRVSSDMSEPCSMQSIPASRAARIPSSPWAWAATLEPGPVGLVDDGRQLLVGVLLGAGRPGMGHHPARRAHLDQPGAVLDLVADGLSDLAHPVGDALLDGEGHDVGRQGLEHGRIEVAPGGGDGVPGRHHPGPFEPAEVDGLHEGHVQQQPAGLDEQTEVAHGGEPGLEGPAGIGHRPQGAEGRVVLDGVEGAPVVGSAEEQIDLHVHQPGQQGQVAQIDLDGPVGHRGRRHVEDPLPGDQQVAGGHDRAAGHVEHAGAAQVDVFRGPGAGHAVLLGLGRKRDCRKIITRLCIYESRNIVARPAVGGRWPGEGGPHG